MSSLRDHLIVAVHGKRKKEDVEYSKGKPQAHCGLCSHFIKKQGACEMVLGNIAPQMWCRLFVRKGDSY